MQVFLTAAVILFGILGIISSIIGGIAVFEEG